MRKTQRRYADGRTNVTEQFSDYSFSVTVHLLFIDSADSLRELIRQIEEIKPAHLLFAMEGALEPAVLKNDNRLAFFQMALHTGISNLSGEAICLNGRHSLDGSWKLNCQFIRGAAFYSMDIFSRAVNQYRAALGWGSRFSIHTNSACKFAGLQFFRYCARNLGIEETRLDRKRALDGSWKLTLFSRKGMVFAGIVCCGKATSSQKTSSALQFQALVGTRGGTAAKVLYGISGENPQELQQKNFLAAAGVKNPQGTNGSVTSRIDRRLDGAFLLNGSKNLFVGTLRSDL